MEILIEKITTMINKLLYNFPMLKYLGIVVIVVVIAVFVLSNDAGNKKKR